MSNLTYIAQIDGPGKLVKVGKSRNPSSRMCSLRTGLPWPLRIVALIGSDIERELKNRFKGDKVQGEWFRPTLALREFLEIAATEGRLVRQVSVDQAYINAVIKPRLKEYLAGREPENNRYGDLVRCVFADLLPTLAGREVELATATKHHVPVTLSRGFGPTNEVPILELDETDSGQKAAAA